tara:strand:- start:7494 stop:8657 length:1164 start_codon:yes stop_codon:yes gene_type:complete
MKIAFFHDHIITQKNNVLYSSGGLNKQVIARYLNLCERFTLVTRNNNVRSVDNLSIVESLDKINYKVIPDLSSLVIKKYKEAYRLLSKIVEENDFLIIRLPSLIGFLAMYIALKKQKKNIIELVGCPYDSYKYVGFKGKIVALPLYWLTKYLVKKAHSVLYVTQSFLQRRYPTKTPMNIGCSDVDIEIISNKLENRLEKLKVNKKYIKIGMIGSLEATYKGYDTVIKALSLLKKKNKFNFKLELVGGGASTHIDKLLSKSIIKDHVIVKGTLSHPAGIFDWLDNIDIYLHPSRTEGLPRSLVEAMSRGCACIGSNVGGIPELIAPQYMHEKNDINKLMKLIEKLFNAEERKKNILKNFEKVSNYDKKILDTKRFDFYMNAIKFHTLK